MMEGALSLGAPERLASTNDRIKPTTQIGALWVNAFKDSHLLYRSK